MKSLATLALIASSLLAAPLIAAAESKPSASADAPNAHRVVFELTSADPEAWNAVLNNIENIRKSLGEHVTKVELVAHGKALDFLKSTNAAHKERMRKLADVGVVFAACENTMKRQNVTKAALLPFVTTVDSGVAEIVRKQEDRWSYVRSGN